MVLTKKYNIDNYYPKLHLPYTIQAWTYGNPVGITSNLQTPTISANSTISTDTTSLNPNNDSHITQSTPVGQLGVSGNLQTPTISANSTIPTDTTSPNPNNNSHVTQSTPLGQLGINNTYNSSAKPAARPSNNNNNSSYHSINHIRSGALWAYIIIVVIVAILLVTIISDRIIDGWYDRLHKPISLPIEVQLALWGALFIVVIFVSYFGHVWATDEDYRQWLTWLFIGHFILLMVWFIMFYGNRNIELGFVFALFSFLSSLIWLFILIPVSTLLTGLLAIYVIWLGYLVIEQYLIFKNNYL